MSLPPELRVLCFKLSTTRPSDLPRLTPTLLRHVSCCQALLSSPASNATQADASASSVLVHKLKTQLSSLLYGKSPEGRFSAAVLIKAVVEVGGWEILHGIESWVRGLLSILGKPDAAAVKEVCVMTLTKIYSMTQQYQTLVREITTPTLPTFVTSCLNLVSTSSPQKVSGGGPTSLEEVIFQSFAMLVPCHPAIFRPFVSQIRVAVRPFLAPTSSDGFFTASSLKDSAHRLAVTLHQTAPKNTSGEEWSKAARGLIRDIHMTADHVFRAVVEDWESSAGYIGEVVDVNQELHGGSATGEDLPLWFGIHAGVERLTGRLELLAAYLKVETAAPVAVPLSLIMDIVTRLLSIAIPSPSASAGKSEARLHPAIDRDERDGLWVGLPQIYVAALQLVDTMSTRLEDNFLPLAQESFDQLAWVFGYGKHSPEFRLIAYGVTAKILFYAGQTFNQSQCDKLTGIYQACCQDLQEAHPTFQGIAAVSSPPGNHNAEAFLRSRVTVPTEYHIADPALHDAARHLLPMFLSHLPQQHLKLATRSLVDRTSILTHNKDAMLASVLNPKFANNGSALPSILPHLTRAFGRDTIVEVLLRPRMPLVPSITTRTIANEAVVGESEDEDMEFHHDSTSIQNNNSTTSRSAAPVHQDPFAVALQPGFGSSTDTPPRRAIQHHSTFGTNSSSTFVPGNFLGTTEACSATQPHHVQLDDPMAQDDDDDDGSDDESVHLTMQLDSESDDDGE